MKRMSVKFDAYTVYARFFPAIVTALPLFVLWYFVAELAQLRNLMNFLLSIRFLGSITFAVVFLYFYAQLIRTTGKALEKRYFLCSRGFPTAYLMLYEDESYSTAYKDRYRRQIHADFGLALPTEAEERSDPENSRKRLGEITKHVILKVGDGTLVKKHNTWYGFWRNLIGGTIFAVVFCFGNVVLGTWYFEEPTLWIFGGTLFVPYGIVLGFHKPILFQHAEAYARQLIAEYLSGSPG